MIKRKGIKQFKRIKIPYMNEATQKRRVERPGCLLEKFKTNPLVTELAVFQDESHFPLETSINSQNDRVYIKGQKKDVPDKNLSHQTNRQSVKFRMSAASTWFGVTKPLFVNKKGLKFSAENFRNHLKKELFHTINKIYPRKDWIFVQDSVTSHTSNLVRDFLKGMIAQSYIKKGERPPKLQCNNSLDYYFWHKVKTKVYENRLNTPFESIFFSFKTGA